MRQKTFESVCADFQNIRMHFFGIFLVNFSQAFSIFFFSVIDFNPDEFWDDFALKCEELASVHWGVAEPLNQASLQAKAASLSSRSPT